MTKLSIRGISLNVKLIGQGTPLVLMHGGPGADLHTMLSFESLADQFTLVFYDHRCNGRSEGADVSSLTWENLTADADALREKLGFEKWAVLGHSFGGYVALEYALRYPNRVSHLVLVDTGGDSRWAQENAPEVLAQRGYSPEMVNLARRFLNGQIEPGEMFPDLMKLGKAYTYHVSPGQIPHMILTGLQTKMRPEALIYGATHFLKGWSVMDRLNEIKAPTLILAGREDFQFPPEHQQELAAGIPNARLVIIDRAGHNVHDEQPVEVQRVLRDFLANARVVSAKPGLKPSAYAAIDAYVEEQRLRLHIPGISLAVVEGDQIAHLQGFGQASPGGKMPSPHTPFFIGSLTKSITATAVMQLIEAGKVELDAPVQRYLPWFRVANPQVSANITVRHLLNQTSSLSTMAGSLILTDFNNRADASERQVRALSTLKINRPPGAKCEYSNLNYNILGLIVEAASGESYAAYIQTHIFDVLEMRHSFSSKEKARQNGLAMGHRHWFSLPFPAPDLPIPRGSLASGQLISSAEDMAHYLIAHLNGGRYGEAQILSAAGIAELHRGAVDFNMLGVSAGRYGMGWFDIDLGQTKTFSHSGNVPDFSAFMALLPEQRSGFILLLNADPYGMPPVTEEVGMGVTALLAGLRPGPVRLDFIQWIMRFLPLVLILQIAGVSSTLRRVSRWRKDPGLRPSSGHLWSEHILLPLIPNLALTAILIYLRSSGLIRFLQLFMPDLAWVTRISGAFAGIWALLRSGLILRSQRRPHLAQMPATTPSKSEF